MAAPGQQPPAGDLATPAFLLSGVGRIVRDEIEAELRRHDLGLRHLSALGHLSRRPDISYSELARRVGVTAQSMQATLRQLEDRGAVERITSAGRGRTARLRLTTTGTHLLSTGRRCVTDVDDRLFGDLDSGDRQDLTRLLLRAYTLSATRRTGARPAPA